MQNYKIVVTEEIDPFEVRFELPAKGGAIEFVFIANGKRATPAEDTEKVVDYLVQRANMTIEKWVTDPPLVGEDGQPMVGADGLMALLKSFNQMHSAAYASYQFATGAKAKLGNSPG